MKPILTTALLVAALGQPLVAETIIVTETTEGKTTRSTSTLVRSQADGLNWETGTDGEDTSRTATTPEGELRVVEWKSPKGNVQVKSDGQVVRVSGTQEGKPLTGSLELKGRVWALGFDQPLKWYARKNFQGPMPFLMLNLEDLTKSTEMVLTREGDEVIKGKKTVRLKIGLTGMMAMFWSAKVWVDPTTGAQVRYQGNKGPGTPDTVIEVEVTNP